MSCVLDKADSNMILEPPTPEQLADIYSELGLTPASIVRDVEYLKEWISQQPHLPDGIVSEERLLENLLVFRKNRIERVKENIDLICSVKHQAPDFFDGFDPLNPDMKITIGNKIFCFLPKLTPEGSRVCIYKTLDANPNLYKFIRAVQLCMMVSLIATMEGICRDTVVVMDLRNIVLGHLATVTIPLAKQFLFFVQKVLPIRLKAVHIIYAPPYMDTIFAVFKPFIKKKLIQRIHFYSGGYGNMFDTLPQKMFPPEYGGEGPSLKALHDTWKKKLIESRSLFQKFIELKSDESKRQGEQLRYDTIFGIQGSFRQLNVD